MSAAVVQAKEGYTTGSASSQATGNFAAPVTAGNLIYAFCHSETDATHSAPTDTLGNTYTQVGTTVDDTVAATRASQWVAQNILGGTNSVTSHLSGTSTLVGIVAVEVSGCRTSGAADVSSIAVNTGDSGADVVVSGTATNTAQPAMVIGAAYDTQGAIEAAGTGFTSIIVGWNDGAVNKMRAEYKLISAIGSQQATWQDTGFDRHLAGMVVLLEPAPAPVFKVNQVTASPMRW